jgi:hypothetical protein
MMSGAAFKVYLGWVVGVVGGGGPTNYLVYLEVELGSGCGWAVTIKLVSAKSKPIL